VRAGVHGSGLICCCCGEDSWVKHIRFVSRSLCHEKLTVSHAFKIYKIQ
jgi:hypothetical protein